MTDEDIEIVYQDVKEIVIHFRDNNNEMFLKAFSYSEMNNGTIFQCLLDWENNAKIRRGEGLEIAVRYFQLNGN